jgi:hypothetical protein
LGEATLRPKQNIPNEVAEQAWQALAAQRGRNQTCCIKIVKWFWPTLAVFFHARQRNVFGDAWQRNARVSTHQT